MDAELVWNTWRRILTSDPLLDAVLHPSAGDRARTMGLGSDEVAIVEDYAGTPTATGTNVGMYRRGLTRNALAALGLVPLSQHLLYTSGVDVEAAAADYVRSRDYADDGPNFWRIAGGFLASLAGRPEFASGPCRDVLALDSAMVGLARRLGTPGGGDEPGSLLGRGAGGEPRFAASRRAVVVPSRFDLTRWLEAPHGFDPAEEPAEVSKHWAIVFPADGAAPDYAELSERAALVYGSLAFPRTLAQVAEAAGDIPDAGLSAILDDLVRLGVAVVEEGGGDGGAGPPHRASDPQGLPPDQLVRLDPEVETSILDGSGQRLLIHRGLATGLVVPDGDGLPDFLDMLSRGPVGVGALRGTFDDRALVDRMLASLRSRGYLLLLPGADPSDADLERAREAARSAREAGLRRSIVVDLDGGAASPERVAHELGGQDVPPALVLRCRRLGEHGRFFQDLADLRQCGRLCLHGSRIRTEDASCGGDLPRHLIRLGASVAIEGVAWPVPDGPVPGLAELAFACVPVVAVMSPGRSLYDPAARDRAVGWARAASVAGLRIRLDDEVRSPDAVGDGFRGLFEAVRSLDDRLGSIAIDDLPDDDVLVGDALPLSGPGRPGGGTGPLLDAYLRWRLGTIASFEQGTLWAQTPEAEEKVVSSEVDFLPGRPDLLALRPGAVLLDVCGGLGRVARRLAPAVGRDGLVISIEMLRWVGDRARHIACRSGLTNIQFREGIAQRLGLPDGCVDAAVNEWTGAVWELGLGRAMVAEMARVVRPGGRIAVTHRLVRLPLGRLHEPWVQYAEIYGWIREAFSDPGLTVVAERIWGQIAPSLAGESPAAWHRRYLPRLIDPVEAVFEPEVNACAHADVCLSIVAQRG